MMGRSHNVCIDVRRKRALQLCLNHTGILYLYTGLADAMPYAGSNLRAMGRGEESATQEESYAAVP